MFKMSLFVKATVIATVVALGLSSVAFAKGRAAKAPTAPATSTPMSAALIQSNWKDELAWLKVDNAVLSRIDRIMERVVSRFDKDLNSKRPDDRLGGRLERTVIDVQVLLSKAQAVVAAHAGFDASGNVTDPAQALKSMQTLGSYLDDLRGTLLYHVEHAI